MPDLTGIGWLIDAWQELTTCRTYTFGGPAPIPMTAIWQWQDRHGAPEWFPETVMLIDATFLQKANKPTTQPTIQPSNKA